MRIIAPISFASRWTPASERGLAGSAHGPRGGWLHGAQLAAEQVAAGLVVSVSERQQIPFLGRLAADRPLRAAPFSFHSSWVFADPLPEDLVHVHVAFGEETTAVASLPYAPKAPVMEPGPLPGDLLVAAHDLALAGDFKASQRTFAQALALPDVADDLVGAHRYNAACAAARAGDRTQAMTWLEQDLKARNAEHVRRTRLSLLEDKPESEDAAIDAPFRAHIRHLREDRDLADLPIDELITRAEGR